jgi:hypothetical protein
MAIRLLAGVCHYATFEMNAVIGSAKSNTWVPLSAPNGPPVPIAIAEDKADRDVSFLL